MGEITALLKGWKLDEHGVRERWHALWLLARGWSASGVADALKRDPHTIGEWLASFRQAGPTGLTFEPAGGSPPPLGPGRRPS